MMGATKSRQSSISSLKRISIKIFLAFILTTRNASAFLNFQRTAHWGDLSLSPLLLRLDQSDKSNHGIIYRTKRTRLNSSFASPLFFTDSEKEKPRILAPKAMSPPISQDANNVNYRYSASDWLHNVRSLPNSQVLRDIRNPVITIASWSTVVSIIYKLLKHSSSRILQKMGNDMCIGTTPHSFLVSALGLLLVFRTNSAYQRFAEGRKIWENILSTSRNLSRMIALYSSDISPERQARSRKLITAFPYLLRHHIRPRCLSQCQQNKAGPHGLLLHSPPLTPVETRQDGEHVVTAIPHQCWVDCRSLPWSLLDNKTILTHVSRAENRPLWVLDRLAQELATVKYTQNFTSRERETLLKHVETLTNAIGACERIHQTAVPLNYARHSLRSLTLWLVTLPFALVGDMGFLTGPAVGVVAWLLFGVYQIGYSIEDPFQGSLRLSTLCDAIRNDVLGDRSPTGPAFRLEEDWEVMGDTLVGEEISDVLWNGKSRKERLTDARTPIKSRIIL